MEEAFLRALMSYTTYLCVRAREKPLVVGTERRGLPSKTVEEIRQIETQVLVAKLIYGSYEQIQRFTLTAVFYTRAVERGASQDWRLLKGTATTKNGIDVPKLKPDFERSTSQSNEALC
jgi:hypothetical protein